MKLKNKLVLVLMALVMALPVLVAAQEKPSDNTAIALEKIRADKRFLVASNMQLSESEAKGFWPLYEEYQMELWVLRARMMKLISDYAESYGRMTNDIAKSLLDEFVTIQTLRPKLDKAYLTRFRKVLPDSKVVRYYQIENKINSILMYDIAGQIPLMEFSDTTAQ
jgi:hypothetical protein